MADAFRRYRRTELAELADWHEGFDMSGVSVSEEDRRAGSPQTGDKIARNPANHADRWLVAASYFDAHFEPDSREGDKPDEQDAEKRRGDERSR